jgi:hypothetical protein
MQVLVNHLKDGGLLVFNNHKNSTSSLYSLARIIKGKNSISAMNDSEVRRLCDEYGLYVVDTYHVGVFPSFDRFILLPLILLSPLESLFSKIKIFKYFAFNIVYVCKLKK